MNRVSNGFAIGPRPVSVLTLGLVLVLIPFAINSAEAFDIEAATRAYLDAIPAEDRLRSDAYYEGRYWLALWSFLYGVAVAWLVLRFGLASRMRDLAKRLVRREWAVPSAMALLYIPLAFVLSLPLSVYDGFFRGHEYGLATQSFQSWIGEQFLQLAVNTVLLAILLGILYTVFRKLTETLWLWGGIVATLFMYFAVFVSPVLIQPLFNDYTPLEEGPLRDELISMARANGIPAEDIYVVDQSRQTTRISANVSGIGSTVRISLNDNLLNDTTRAEIRAVMGHEIGHYALGHRVTDVIMFGLVITVGLAFMARGYDWVRHRYGSSWRIGDISDPAGLPLVIALMSAYLFAMTPVVNRLIYAGERQADLFGLQAAHEPEGFARAAMRLATYRKLEPGPLEEFLLFDHPSGYSRVKMAMTWRAENPLSEAGNGGTIQPVPASD